MQGRQKFRSETQLLCEHLKRLRRASQLASQLLQDCSPPPPPPSIYHFRPRNRPLAPLKGPTPPLGVGFEAVSANTTLSYPGEMHRQTKYQRRSIMHKNHSMPQLPVLQMKDYRREKTKDKPAKPNKKQAKLGLVEATDLSGFR